MRIGLTIFATDRSMNPVELAREAETRGFYSLYVPEHTHIPVSRRTPPPTGESELPEEYKRTHDPIVLAKTIATLDHLSGGRLVLGIGYGWNVDEMESHGVEARRRRAIVREKMLAMQALWSQDVAQFSGEFVRFEPSWQWPKPVQRPRPRVWIGGAAGPTLFAHIAEFADGWMPVGGAGMQAALPELRRAFEARGRDPATLDVAPMGVLPDPAKLAFYASIGITEAVLRLPSAPRDVVMPLLDDYARYLKPARAS